MDSYLQAKERAVGNEKYNKALKRDSCRVAFLVCSNFCGEIGLRKVGLGGSHPLTQRYVSKRFYD
ncbi:DUF3265 domain-containing protein [Vibrio vulnificus]|nr:DUF3265 domain-containing protein [Vibrio vulnificus]EIJ0948482.1 DUF3265 domain-containing protein [Vibrio vulnificus]EJD0676868.1 DUF3265 domain-containing protein [Vibrio vulnificus]EJZ7973282.1 DUF3265 domain-containing protein [Vibrio vulnificus]